MKNFCIECGHVMSRNNTCQFCESTIQDLLFNFDDTENKKKAMMPAIEDDFPIELFLSSYSLDEATPGPLAA